MSTLPFPLMWSLLLCTSVLMAQKPPTSSELEIKIDAPNTAVLDAGKDVGNSKGHPHVIHNAGFQLTNRSSPEAMAYDYLSENLLELDLSQQDLDNLKIHAIRESQSGTTVRYRQYWQSIPVVGGEIAITINPSNVVTFVSNGFRYNVQAVDYSPTITEMDARGIVVDHLKIAGHILEENIELVIFEYANNSELYYRVRLLTEDPMGDWEGLVHTKSGTILQLLDKACYYHKHIHPEVSALDLTGTASMNGDTGICHVYDPDPLAVTNSTYGETGYSDDGDSNSVQLDAARVIRALPGLSYNGSIYSLVGPYAQIVDFESPNTGLFSQDTSTWDFPRSELAFEAVNTYYHIDVSMRYINETLGMNIMPYQYNGGVKFDPHGLNGRDNSHYLQGSGRISFGQGGVDDAEDSDVIWHELGHGIHDWVTQGGISQVEGLSEGTGDYWAASYNRGKGLWTPAQAPFNWVFNWDGHNEFWPGRIVNYEASYPDGLTGGIHTDGQIWSTAMMKVWDAIGKEKTDKAFWNGLGMTSANSNQNDAANAVYQAAIAMNYSSDDLQMIYTIFTNTGYTLPNIHNTPPNDVCNNAEVIPISTFSSRLEAVGGSLANANSSVNELIGEGCDGVQSSDIWYTFIAVGDVHCIEFSDFVGDSTDVLWSVWTGTCGDLTSYICAQSSHRTALSTMPNQSYYIRIYSESAEPVLTSFSLSIQTCSEAPIPCTEDEIVLSSPIISNGMYQAMSHIESMGEVVLPSTGQITLQAGSSIDLNPGFSSELGSTLTVNIVSCNPPAAIEASYSDSFLSEARDYFKESGERLMSIIE